jgi:hypothetical protein
MIFINKFIDHTFFIIKIDIDQINSKCSLSCQNLWV